MSHIKPEVIIGITGITGGIGQGLKAACLDRGYHVVGFSRCPTADAVKLDLVEDEPPVATVIKATAERVGNFTAWVNLAGADILSEPLRSMSYEAKLKHLWEVDVLGSVRCTQGVLPSLTADGCVINIGWDEAFTGHQGVHGELYAMAKAAVIAYSMSLAKTLESSSKKVFVFSPGWVRTRWHESLTNQQRDAYIQFIANGAWQTPQMLGEAIADLITNRAAIRSGSQHVLPEPS